MGRLSDDNSSSYYSSERESEIHKAEQESLHTITTKVDYDYADAFSFKLKQK